MLPNNKISLFTIMFSISITLFSQVDNGLLLKTFANDKELREYKYLNFNDCDTIFVADTLHYFGERVFKDNYGKLILVSEKYLDRVSCYASKKNCRCYNFYINKVEHTGKKATISFSYPILNVYGYFTYRIKKNKKLRKIKSKIIFVD